MWISLGLTFLFTRFFRIEQVPNGLHVDEAGMLYDAFCLGQYGTDRWMNELPVYLTNFGGGQSALYAYLTVVCVRLFGVCAFAARIPAVVGGALVLVFGTLLAKQVLGKTWAFAVAALVVICPYFVMASRFGLDCNLLLGFFTMAVYMLYMAVKSGKYRWYLAAGTGFGICLYCYALAYGEIPLFLLLVCAYLIWIRKFEIRKWIVLAIPLGCLALPLLLFLAVNNGMISPLTIDLGFAAFSVPELPNYRGSELSLSNVKENLILFKNILTYGPLSYNALPAFGTMYYISVPFILLGAAVAVRKTYFALKKKELSAAAVIVFMSLAVVLFNLLVEDTRVINKNNAVFFALAYFAVEGIRFVARKCKIALLIVAAVYLAGFVSFGVYYYSGQAEEASGRYFNSSVIEALEYTEEKFESEEKAFYFFTDMPGIERPAIYLLLHNKVSARDHVELYSKDVRWYGKYCVILPDEPHENDVYILRGADQFRERLIDEGFQIEWLGDFAILHHE